MTPYYAVRCGECGAVGVFPAGLAGGPALCEHPAAGYRLTGLTSGDVS